jgi:membrane protease subunit HflC
LWIIVVIVVALVLVRLSLFTVGPTEFVYLTQFGQHIATYDGADSDHDAGLHVCWPWPVESVQRLDRRLQYFDLPAVELPTRDADSPDAPGKLAENRIDKMLIVEAYVCWRIADRDAVDLFIRTLGTAGRAQDILGQRINSQLGAAISQLSTKDLINTNAALVEDKMHELWQGMLDTLKPTLRTDYGVDLVDVRLRRFYHSPQVTKDIFDAIKAKRKEKAQEYYSKGDYEKNKIMKDADLKAKFVEADAEKYAEQKKKDAETDALEIRNQAYKKDKELHEFLQKLEALKVTLKQNKTLLLLSTHRTFFEMLFQPPNPGAGVGAVPANPAAQAPDKSAKNSAPKSPPGGN